MSAYDKVILARSKGRPTGAAYIENVFDGFLELHGDRRFADDPAIVGGLALLENVNDETFSVEKIVQFYPGHQALDSAFHWGMRWQAGRK